MVNVADDDKVVPVDETDIPALEGLVGALLDENQRTQWELLVTRARAGELTAPERIGSKRDAYTWLAWARANLHQAGCMCHRCMASRRALSGELAGM